MLYQNEIHLKSTGRPSCSVKLKIREPKQDVLIISFLWHKKMDKEMIAILLWPEDKIRNKKIRDAAKKICEHTYLSSAAIPDITKMIRDMISQVI